jgi:uncharacterized protein (DUF2252 family)
MTHTITPQERRSLGQSRRKQLARQDHCRWHSESRSHNPLTILEESMRGRVASLVAIKYERMAASPFGFFRGAVPVMAADLATLPNTGIVNQICGDAHVQNLGAYAAPDGRLVFDINDFDETTRGPFEWDIKRLATSLILVGRQIGTKSSACSEAVLTFVSAYRRAIDMFSRMPVLEVARYQVHRLQRIAPLSEVLQKSERATPLRSLELLTEPAKPPVRSKQPARVFKNEPPILTRLSPAKARAVLASLNSYREVLTPERRHFLQQYRPLSVAFKVVGTGSVGLRDYCIYFEGNGPEDPLFLQIKEEPGSAYAPYVDQAGLAQHQGQRCADGQRAMQFQSDPFLGWTTIANRDYLVRQLNDHKASINPEELKGPGLGEYAQMCGELLARGHARSGDACVLAGYLGNGKKFGEAVATFANAYADQTEKDWKLLVASRRAPRKVSSKTAKP